MKKKQTAVDWLASYIKGITDLNCDEIIEQAKQMEKEQMKEAHLIADHYPRGYEFEQYYNETYGGQDEN